MKVVVEGATGAIGRRLVPRLLERGHEVTGTTRSETKARELNALGAHGIALDPFDREAVIQAVVAAAPDVVAHELTALASFTNPKHFDDEFALTNRLRTEALDHLLDGARAAGARRVVAQSYTGWTNPRTGAPLKTEADPLDPNPPATMRRTLEAIRHVETAVAGAKEFEGLALRYGPLYGPGTSLGLGGAQIEPIRKRQFPIIGDGGGIWSFLHIEDAAEATAIAIERGPAGMYNIVDDDPAPVREWLPYLAALIGAKPPRHLPVWLGRLAVGEAGVLLMTQTQGSSNAKAKRDLGWSPCWPSWREGFRAALAGEPAKRAA